MAFERVKALADELDRHPMAVAAVLAAGMSDRLPGIYGPFVSSLAEIARHFGVAERTAAAWLASGAPRKTDRGYSLAAWDYWRWLERPESDFCDGGVGWSEPDIPERLIAGLLRAIQAETLLALEGFAECVDDPKAAEKLQDFIAANLQGSLILSEDQIQAVAAALDHSPLF